MEFSLKYGDGILAEHAEIFEDPRLLVAGDVHGSPYGRQPGAGSDLLRKNAGPDKKFESAGPTLMSLFQYSAVTA